VTKEKGDVLQGTLDMLVLKALQLEPMHGWGITERIEQWSERVLQLGQGTLYPALYRLEHPLGLARHRQQPAGALLLIDRARPSPPRRVAGAVAAHVARDQPRTGRDSREVRGADGCAC
jgi:hypothetical protein